MSVGTVSQINEDDYEFATHVVKVKRSGQIIDVSSLWEMEGGAVSLTSSCLGAEKDKFKVRVGKRDRKNKLSRFASELTFLHF